MKKSSLHIISVLLFLSSLFSSAQNDDLKGYKIEGDDVVFIFDKRDYKKATKDEHGDVIDFKNLNIDNVSVSGEFNNWSRHKWKMTKIDDNRYELRKRLIDFTDEFSWEFKFVINNSFWAEPTRNTVNKADAKDPYGSPLHVYNLKLYTAYPKENGNASFKLKGFENAKKIILTGTFNRWNEQIFVMNKVSDGWELTLQLNPGEYEYKFIVDGKWMEDPNNPSKKANEYDGYNSVLNIKVPHTFILKGYENASKVILSGDFNDWSENNYQMKKTSEGWSFTCLLSGGKHHYKFIVDGNWILDPNNTVKEYDNDGNINSVCMIR